MLQFFRINDPYRIIFVFLALVIVRTAWLVGGLPLSIPELKWLLVGERLGDHFTMYKDLYDHTGPLAAFVYKSLDMVFGRSRWVHIVFSTLLITVQAGVLNSILLKSKAYDENSYVPAFLYVILMSGVVDFFALSPQLLALTFLLMSLKHIFRRIDNVITDELFIYAGLYLGLATCFYLPAVIFFVVFVLSFLIFSTAIARRMLLLIYSSLVVVAIIWVYFFWFGAAWDFIADFFVAGIMKPRFYYIEPLLLAKAAGFLIFVSLISFYVMFTQRGTNFQQKLMQMMVAFFIAGLLVIVLSKDLMTADLVFVIPTLTFFTVYYVFGLKRRVWKTIAPYFLVIGLLGYPVFLIQSDSLSSMIVKDEVMPVEGERLMCIGCAIEAYASYQIAGPFLDEYVSRSKLDDIDYYDEASHIYEALEQSTPEVIIDRWEEADKLFYRFPKFGERYQRLDDKSYQLKSSN